ncbi:DUF1116 domain-containing protein [Rhodoligotrophos defluvii]|uniref:oxamate carbamoyltransferase subunit AllG family protein n=1 Tax=Rhodoligotrophos defluvii TaxID=2561934 RepID=UPI0010C937B6|nr:DUF1116 domain-containing protein [Rhodoligotrophos defluvii]
MQLSAADGLGFAKIAAARPAWSGVRRLSDAVRGLQGRYVLHAGPPFRDRASIPAPVRNSLCAACIYEGWAASWSEAEALLAGGAINMVPAQDCACVVPLAGVLSPSMPVLEVIDLEDRSATFFAAVNEGQRHATRLGMRDERLPGHLRWLGGTLAPWLEEALQEPIELLPLMGEALARGDDCHSRTVHGSAAIAAALRGRNERSPPDVHAFLDTSPAFALNLWMGAAALMLRSAEGTGNCTLVTRAGGNGENFGIQLAGRPGVWVTMPAPVPFGPVDATARDRSAVGAVGDSALVDFLGLGAQALATAPEVARALSGYLPKNAGDRARSVLAGELPGLGRRAVTSAALAAEADVGPLVLLGMIDRAGVAGRIGGGVVDVPPQLFAQALRECI